MDRRGHAGARFGENRWLLGLACVVFAGASIWPWPCGAQWPGPPVAAASNATRFPAAAGTAPATDGQAGRAASGASNSSAASNVSGASGVRGVADAAAAAQAASEAAARAALALSAKQFAEVNARLDPRDGLRLRDAFAAEVTRRLPVPERDASAYAERLQAALAARGLAGLARQYVVLVDRAPRVQALFIYFRGGASEPWRLIGASPVATGLPRGYEHFFTPLGVFAHTPQNMDFRAEGTDNENGIRGYGAKGARIFDFGWTQGERGWGRGGASPMRLQMHSTDPDKLEPLLGIPHSKGCVRIPGSLDAFLDRHGVLDADYEVLAGAGNVVRVLHGDREATPWAGRYLVVVDSGSPKRPAWAPEPAAEARARMSEAADTAD
ncbi:L,D-transpeptidase [Trinickia caryophylli]|nr:L,D-transpeptidase [Trinickia caryophylli]TRX14802.1 hypothetical protein FNF07_26565 [Trinickia caryophylli]WQE14648.1 L,D-transpeptidase [Trinickia caryophylli]